MGSGRGAFLSSAIDASQFFRYNFSTQNGEENLPAEQATSCQNARFFEPDKNRGRQEGNRSSPSQRTSSTLCLMLPKANKLKKSELIGEVISTAPKTRTDHLVVFYQNSADAFSSAVVIGGKLGLKGVKRNAVRRAIFHELASVKQTFGENLQGAMVVMVAKVPDDTQELRLELKTCLEKLLPR